MKEKLLELLKRTDISFSSKETRVLELLAQGLHTKDVARIMRTSRKAVNNHITTMRGRGLDIPELKDTAGRPGRKKIVDYLRPIDKTVKPILVNFDDELLIKVKVSDFLAKMLGK